MIIRKYKAEDYKALRYLWQTIFPDNSPHNDPATVIDAKLKVDDLIFVSEFEGEIIGACMAGYDGHRGWLYAVGVMPKFRRRGTATMLVQHAIQNLKQLGCGKVNLQIRSTNQDVASFYESLGFIKEDRLSMSSFID